MLTTYDRIMREARVTRTGSVTVDNRSEPELVKQLQAEVEALRKRVREMTAKVAIALFSLAFIAGCTTPTVTYTYETRPCPAPLTASGCATWLGR